jgi:hypothetical protein
MRFQIVQVVEQSRIGVRSQVAETDRQSLGPNDLESDPTLHDPDNPTTGQQAPRKENLHTVYRIEFVIMINRTSGAWLNAKSSPTL